MTQDKIYNYFERNPRLHVLFVFDPFGDLEAELSEWTWKDGYRYVAFDGGWFKTKYAIEHDWKDEKVILLFRQNNPSNNQQSMLDFPLMDVLAANMDLKVDDYAAFIQQYHIVPSMAPFVQNHITELQQTRVTKILGPYYKTADFTMDVAHRGLLSAYLGADKLLDWNMIIIKLLIQDVNSGLGTVTSKFQRNPTTMNALNSKLDDIFGVKYEYNSLGYKMQKVAECLKYNVITQSLSVNTSKDEYRKYKVESAYALQQMNSLWEYPLNKVQRKQFEDAVSVLAEGVKDEEILKCYGVDANYYKITTKMAVPIVMELLKKASNEPALVAEKTRELDLRMGEDNPVQPIIAFVGNIANYYKCAGEMGTLCLNTPSEYLAKYQTSFYLTDTYYRHILESFKALDKSTEQYDTYHQAKVEIDRHYATLTNNLNLEWVKCLVAKGTKLNQMPDYKAQQNFYRDNRNKDVKQVVIISDALRYEVAKELLGELAKEKHIATLDCCIAMLPTETKFCKKALFPHSKLELKEADMLVNGSDLTTTSQRSDFLNGYVKGATCVSFEDVEGNNQQTNRELFKRPLVYVIHNTIDEAGHNGDIIDACRKSIQQIAKLVKSLHASFNVANVIVTSDHGFLYNDLEFEEKDKQTITEEVIEKKTRYYLTKSDEEVHGVAKFRLADVSGMEEDVFVAVPTGTNRFAAAGSYQFAHGGAALQEIVAPVIYSKLKKDDTKEKTRVLLMNKKLSMVSSRVKFQLIQSDAVSMEVQGRTIVCGIYNNDELLTAVKEIVMDSSDGNAQNRFFDVELTLNKPTDASILQLKIYDVEDDLNPLIKETVKNNTLIEQDF
ncbi:MAG: PglZ domain-containing protein [Bacteroidales bacterium]|nr:PglZ domain-containing protein [Bacteroidales bacterium]